MFIYFFLLISFGCLQLSASPIADSNDEALRNSLTGDWKAAVGKETLILRLLDSGEYQLDEARGTWSVQQSDLVLQDVAETEYRYTITLDQSGLTLSGPGLKPSLKFNADLSRTATLTTFNRWVQALTPQNALNRLFTIVVILLIILTALLLIRLLRWISNTLITSERGSFRFLSPEQKARTRTIYSVALNVLTYVIVFIAIGRILAEVGVNTTAYIASLSVIGLAIGFGSQGLVQDFVSGFFIILDNQFSVGDLVEISGQTGYVEEVGLRTTRLRNYMGQMVVIPNRSIAVVGNYRNRGMLAKIDIGFGDKKTAEERLNDVHKFGRELSSQFSSTVMRPPGKPALLLMQTGEVFVRMELQIWPQQQGFVEKEIVPRLRELLGGKPTDNATPMRIVCAFSGYK